MGGLHTFHKWPSRGAHLDACMSKGVGGLERSPRRLRSEKILDTLDCHNP